MTAPSANESAQQSDMLPNEREVRAFVGPHADYYLASWKTALEANGAVTGVHWGAMLFPIVWLPLRKMYRATFLLYFVLLLAAIIEFYGAQRLGADGVVGLIIFAGVFGICGVFANRWYLGHTIAVIDRIRGQGLEEYEYYQQLRKRGGVSIRDAVTLFNLFAILFSGLVFLLHEVDPPSGKLGQKLTFNGSDIFYLPPVQKEEVEKLGNHLVGVGFFAGRPVTVQLLRRDKMLQFRVVVKPGLELDPQVANGARELSVELSRNVFNGDRVEIHFCDDMLQTKKVIPAP